MTRRAIACLIGGCLALLAGLTSAQADAACPNEQLRGGASSRLAECRAYEMVSPVNKNGGSVNQNVNVEVDGGGERVTFVSAASFAGAPASPQRGLYLATREGGNWQTRSADAPQLNPHGFLSGATPASTLDLTKFLQASKVALTPGAIEGGSNVYMADPLTGERTLLAAAPGNVLFETLTTGAATPFGGGSPDWGRLFLQTEAALTPEALVGATNVYELSGGQVRLASLLPDGTPVPGHLLGTSTPFAHPVSADGSRIFFTNSPVGTGPLYMRRNGTTTVPISASQRSADAGTIASAEFRAASVDGSAVFFTSFTPLTEATESSTGSSLYRYDVASGQLTDLTLPLNPGDNPGATEVSAMSEDGSYVYFAAAGVLADGAEEISGSAVNLYVWHDGEVRYIAKTDPQNGENAGPTGRLTSPDGRYLGLASYSPLTGEDVPSPDCPSIPGEGNAPEACKDVYLYDYASDQLRCVSCDGGPGAGNSNLGGQFFVTATSGDRFPRAVLDDGTVFFDSPNRLTGSDVNGVGDAYAWKAGVATLLSTGTSEFPSNFAGATADGASAFIRTQQQLVPQDVDQSMDLYAARIGGGLPAQQGGEGLSPCQGESCRGSVPAAPGGPAVQSATLLGAGNAAKRCNARNRKPTQRRHKRGQAKRHQGQHRAARKAGAGQKGAGKRKTNNARNCGGKA